MPTREEVIASFDPNGVGQMGKLFGLPFDEENARVVVIPVPWEVTVSYRAGTASGPEAILEASPQIDYHDFDIRDAWQKGIALFPNPHDWRERSDALRPLASAYIQELEEGAPVDPKHEVVQKINAAAEELKAELREISSDLLSKGKVPVVLGGDHSTPLGLMEALAAHYGDFGILQIDAHADLRAGYEGFTYSHASIMYNALQLPQVSQLVQVGIRDICEEEVQRVKDSQGRIALYSETRRREEQFEGRSWEEQCQQIIASLPQRVYVSFDIDGLDPKLCPNTGTPVPGGLEFEEAVHLLRSLVKSGRQIIGADLCEVAPGADDWDGNVGARVLYKLCSWAAHSQR